MTHPRRDLIAVVRQRWRGQNNCQFQSRTIQETKESQKCNPENDWKVFYVAYLERDKHSGHKHDRRNGKSVSVRELRGIVECGDNDDRYYHNWWPVNNFAIIF